MWLKKNKGKLIIALVIIAALTAAYFYGGAASVSAAPQAAAETAAMEEAPEITAALPPSAPEAGDAVASADHSEKTEAAQKPEEAQPLTESAAAPGENDEAEMGADADEAETDADADEAEMGADADTAEPAPQEKPLPVEPENVVIGSEERTCTLSISCATILDNIDLCASEKKELVPSDGWILCPTEVTFYEGESVFNVLQRTCKQQKIHLEFENTPIYNSAYIEGIHNLYEFDVGETSGWMYRVNGWFPNYGCSRYLLEDGDTVEWVYTCNLGEDVGGGMATGSQTGE